VDRPSSRWRHGAGAWGERCCGQPLWNTLWRGAVLSTLSAPCARRRQLPTRHPHPASPEVASSTSRCARVLRRPAPRLLECSTVLLLLLNFQSSKRRAPLSRSPPSTSRHVGVTPYSTGYYGALAGQFFLAHRCTGSYYPKQETSGSEGLPVSHSVSPPLPLRRTRVRADEGDRGLLARRALAGVVVIRPGGSHDPGDRAAVHLPGSDGANERLEVGS
jgi:hypothetical protein